MADTVYTRVLAQAAEMHGSTQALASALRVPENTLLRWLCGRAQMPLQAFRRAIEMLAEHEKNAAPLDLPAQPGEKVGFAVDGTGARCAGCGAMEFLSPVPRDALRVTTRLECAACKLEVVHGELIAALATLAVKQSRKGTRPQPAQDAEASTARPRPRS
jgi:hypothetical protein